MTAVLVATAVTVVAGAIVAVSSRDARVVLAGLAVSLVTAPLLAEPVPAPLPLVARLIGAVLAVELLWIAVRASGRQTRGSLAGWAAESLAAAGALVVGIAATSALAPGEPSGATAVPLVVGAAAALATLAVVPLVAGRDALRLAVGAALLTSAAIALEAGLSGPPTPFEQLVAAGAVVAAGVAGAALVANAFEARGDLSLVGPAHPAASSSTPAPHGLSPRVPGAAAGSRGGARRSPESAPRSPTAGERGEAHG